MSEHQGGDNKFIFGLLVGLIIGLVLGAGGAGTLLVKAQREAAVAVERAKLDATVAQARQAEAENLFKEARDKLKEFEARQPKEPDKKP
jgi:hypothetical protein